MIDRESGETARALLAELETLLAQLRQAYPDLHPELVRRLEDTLREIRSTLRIE